MKKQEKIALVIDDKDICRIIPFNPYKGAYEIKLDFLNNEYTLNLFPLFATKPIIRASNNSSQFELTYHKENNGKAPKIHLKRKFKTEGENQYENLPLQNIQSPNVNQLLPLPLVKIEIPEARITKTYKNKKNHKLLAPINCNVVELYLVHKGFDYKSFMEKFPTMHLAFTMLSFEVFATNSVLTDKQKIKNISSTKVPKTITTSFPIFEDIRIIANHFYDPTLNNKLPNINVTFIDNALSESILSMMKVEYPKNNKNGMYDKIYIGTSSFENLNQPFHPILKPSIGKSTVIEDSLSRNTLDNSEREKIYWHAVNLREKLLQAMKQFK